MPGVLTFIQLIALISYVFVADAPWQAPATVAIATIDVTGASRYTRDEVVRASGLTPGPKVAVDDLNAAMQRLAGTGLYDQVNYRYAPAGGGTVTIEIDEAEWTLPVDFDNFIWLTDEELIQGLRVNVLSFDGKVPVNSGAGQLVTSELQKMVAAKGVAGEVELVPQGNLKEGITKYLFRVKDAGLKVCSLKFPGAAKINEQELSDRLGVVGQEYSRSYLSSASAGTLALMYRQRGHWTAKLAQPKVALGQGGACQGVNVTVNVEEGPEYAWGPPVWNGNAALAQPELERLLALKKGDVANVTNLDDGLRKVGTAYQKQGYVRQGVSYEPRLDASSRTAVAEITISEGPQFRLGSLEFAGLSPADAGTLKKIWKLPANAIFDSTYPGRFLTEELRPRLRSGAALPKTEYQVDEENRLVHVRFVFGA